MEVLLLESDPLVRDLVKIGLQQCAQSTVTLGKGFAGLAELRTKHFDCVFVGLPSAAPEALQLLERLRALDQAVEVFVLAPADAVKKLAATKAQFGVHAILSTPLQERELFSLVGRFLDRCASRLAAR